MNRRPESRQRKWTYRLPTEAEWEYACRGGGIGTAPFHFGRTACSTQANFNGTQPYGRAPLGPSLGRPCPVGSYPPNAVGLYDMHGNVWEWCQDRYGPYEPGPATDPKGPTRGNDRVNRGGGWDGSSASLRTANRYGDSPTFGNYVLGVRLALEAR